MAIKTMKKGVSRMLTAKQEKFVQNIVNGMSQIDAYKDAYSAGQMSDNAISREASLLMKNPKVAQRHKELGDKTASKAIMTAQERLEYLTGVIKETNKEKRAVAIDGKIEVVEAPADLNTKLKAIDLMNKMQGEYVQKIEADVKSEVSICIELSDD
jgi:phage terminase small subunit